MPLFIHTRLQKIYLPTFELFLSLKMSFFLNAVVSYATTSKSL
jgi:hypothetical protein